MSGNIRAIIGVVLILIITLGAIIIFQNVGKRVKVDVTEQKFYTLSSGTKSILGKLNQPITLKLYYSKTAAMKGPDQIKYFNNYYEFVKSLLDEYVAAAKGMVKLEIIDPRPFSDEEVQATRYGLKKFPITEEENFFFGLVARTQFGVEKAIPFFAPDRQNFVEYDVSRLIDTAITRQKMTIGVLSSLPVMGEASEYMAQMMRMQGQQPKVAWAIIEHLRQQYEVKNIPVEANEINDIDILLVIHPKKLSQETLFAIDQFVLKGGRMIVCVDPHCYADQENPMMSQFGGSVSQGSELNKLLNTWGLDMPAMTFAGDRELAVKASAAADQRPDKIIGFLNLTPPDAFSSDSVITAQLNSVRVLFAGVLNEIGTPDDANAKENIKRAALAKTTPKGNSFELDSTYEITMLKPSVLMKKFVDGDKPVVLGYMLTGRLKSSFPEGIDIEQDSKSKDPNEPAKPPFHVTGLTEASSDCAVIVFSDVDFISDPMAYSNTIFGKIVVADNSALLMNAIDALAGSSELISIRSRGGVRRPFTVVDKIEAQADAETAKEVEKINAEIAGFEEELKKLVTSANEEQKQIIGGSIVQKTKDLELKKLRARRQLREVNMKKRQRIEQLGNKLRAFNMLAAPAVILIIAVVLGLRRSVMKRHYISHASDA
ncbi:MAG: Gldg family protein [Sedimentisphaerales bacterium]|nr:Gldg family protein [Sedimentisphaerales bacterium]